MGYANPTIPQRARSHGGAECCAGRCEPGLIVAAILAIDSKAYNAVALAEVRTAAGHANVAVARAYLHVVVDNVERINTLFG
jgi:hypothetical protein